MTPVYVWSDRLAKRVLIGYSVFDGKELLPDRSERRDDRFWRHRDPGPLPSQREMASRSGTKVPTRQCVVCGQKCFASRCLACRRADERARVAASTTCPICGHAKSPTSTHCRICSWKPSVRRAA